MGEKSIGAITKVLFINNMDRVIETSVNVSKRAFAMRLDHQAFAPIFSADCLLIIDPEMKLFGQGFALIERNGKQTICFIKENQANEYFIKRSFAEQTYSPLSDDEAICGIVVHIKKDVEKLR
tara:strand:- start:266 stop:634 length:369 start_codon:yes stop_codon:yes gene_type:complete